MISLGGPMTRLGPSETKKTADSNKEIDIHISKQLPIDTEQHKHLFVVVFLATC